MSSSNSGSETDRTWMKDSSYCDTQDSDLESQLDSNWSQSDDSKEDPTWTPVSSPGSSLSSSEEESSSSSSD